MSTATIEAVPVEDLEELFSKVPECELWVYAWKCRNPAAFRVKTTCSCGAVNTSFMCARCYAGVRAGRARCNLSCPGTVDNWTEV